MICIQSRNIISGLKLLQLFPKASYLTRRVFCNIAVFFVGASCTFSALSLYQPVTLAQPVCCVQPISSISNLIWEAAVSYEFRACFVWVKQIEWY